jgi:hypothetical protein
VSGNQAGDTPSVAIAADGRVLVAWRRLAGLSDQETVVAQRAGDPPAWSAPVALGLAAQFDRPQAAWDALGTPLAAWLAPEGVNAQDLRAAAGPAWAPASLLGMRAGYFPVLTKGPGVLAAWIAGRAVLVRDWTGAGGTP